MRVYRLQKDRSTENCYDGTIAASGSACRLCDGQGHRQEQRWRQGTLVCMAIRRGAVAVTMTWA
jgi:hypothetical protein